MSGNGWRIPSGLIPASFAMHIRNIRSRISATRRSSKAAPGRRAHASSATPGATSSCASAATSSPASGHARRAKTNHVRGLLYGAETRHAMTFDVIIIGSGQAGVPLATRLATLGKRVLLAERGELGGTCVNTGCTPTKTMIASARAAHVARTAGRLGVQAKQVEVDFAAVVARKDAIVRRWRESVSKRLQAERLTVARGHARFVGERKVEVGGEGHRAESIVINVCARPLVPPIDGLSAVPWLDNATLMQLRELPAHLLVLG